MSLEEFLAQLRQDATPLNANEEATKLKGVQPILALLGWNTQVGGEVVPEFPVGSDRVDYCLTVGPKKVFVEAKVAGKSLEGDQEKLLDYAFREGVELAALTTGLLWWLYLPLKRGHWNQRRFVQIDIQKDADAARRLETFLSRNAVADGSAFQAAHDAIIQRNLQLAWRELYQERRESLIEALGKKLRDLTGYEADRALLESFLDQQPRSSPIAPQPPQVGLASSKADKVMEVLQDGEWHTASELRKRLRKSSINPTLKKLQGAGQVELIQDKIGNRVRKVAQRSKAGTHQV